MVLADPNVGGRYSALTAFGLVPSRAGRGRRGPSCSTEARRARRRPGATTTTRPRARARPSARRPRPAATSSCWPTPAPASSGFGDWAEQLVAESTGKHGTRHPAGRRRGHRRPRLRRRRRRTRYRGRARRRRRPGAATRAAVSGSLGAQFLALGVRHGGGRAGPRHQPVRPAQRGRVARTNTDEDPGRGRRRAAARGHAGARRGRDRGVRRPRRPSARRPTSPACWPRCSARSARRGYLAVMAYLDRLGDADAAGLRPRLAAALGGRPVTFGWGPRFLHSTGQYHKGGPQVGRLPAGHRRGRPSTSTCPGGRTRSAGCRLAQALGDRQALAERGRPVAAAAPDRPAAGLRPAARPRRRPDDGAARCAT